MIPFLVAGILSQAGRPIIINATGFVVNRQRAGANCFAQMRIATDGEEHFNAVSGIDDFSGTNEVWLTKGNSSNVWIERVITGGTPGTLNHHDPGAGRLQLNVDRDYGIVEVTTLDVHTVNFDLNFYDAASGGNLLATANYSLRAEKLSP